MAMACGAGTESLREPPAGGSDRCGAFRRRFRGAGGSGFHSRGGRFGLGSSEGRQHHGRGGSRRIGVAQRFKRRFHRVETR
jgi:hypothetical protein